MINMKKLLVAVALSTVGVVASASTLVPNDWTYFGWIGLGPIDVPSNGFQLTTATAGDLLITDSFVTGDAYEVYVDGSLFLTSTGGTVAQSLGLEEGAAYYSNQYSKAKGTLAAGTYQIDIKVISTGSGYTAGGGHVYFQSAVPEPGSMAVLGIGVAAFLRRRARR